MTTNPVAVRVSAATRLYGSCSRHASRMASETWSAILSGWPSVTDSEVNRKRSLKFELLPIEGTWDLVCFVDFLELYKRLGKPTDFPEPGGFGRSLAAPVICAHTGRLTPGVYLYMVTQRDAGDKDLQRMGGSRTSRVSG